MVAAFGKAAGLVNFLHYLHRAFQILSSCCLLELLKLEVFLRVKFVWNRQYRCGSQTDVLGTAARCMDPQRRQRKSLVGSKLSIYLSLNLSLDLQCVHGLADHIKQPHIIISIISCLRSRSWVSVVQVKGNILALLVSRSVPPFTFFSHAFVQSFSSCL